MDNTTESKILATVTRYERDYADEFRAYKKQKRLLVETISNEFAATKGDHVMERELFTLPETLYNMIRMALTVDEYSKIWNSKDPKCTGAVWFARTFPQYRTGQKL